MPETHPLIEGPRIVLLCSYPRSGSNWVGDVLSLSESARLGEDPAQRRLFHDLEGLRAQGQLDRFYTRTPRMIFLKTHELPGALFDRSPGLEAWTRAIVTVLRHPLDVLVSSFRYALWAGRVEHEGQRVDAFGRARELGYFDRYVDRFIEHAGDPAFIGAGYGSWLEHSEAWAAPVGVKAPIVRARYSDLLRSPVKQFARIAREIPMLVSEQHIADAVQTSTPARTAELLGKGFVHGASDGSHTELLSADQRARAMEVFGPAMGRYGLGEGPSSSSTR